MPTPTTLILTTSITTSLLSSGAIATLSLFDVPLLTSLPASRSLPLTRWLFSRGSHLFPTAALLSSSGFAYLAYTSASHNLSTLLATATSGGPASYYIAAAALSIAIAPWTQLVMIPTNFELIEKNEAKGGRISEGAPDKATRRSAEGSVNNEGGKNQLTDLSGPQGRTEEGTSREEDEEVRELLVRFGRLNAVRAVLIGVGGVVGLVGALA